MFKPASETPKHIKVAVYGPAASGKTLFAIGWPAVAVIDTEGRAQMYGDSHQFLHTQVRSLVELEAAIDAAARSADIQTVVIDSISVVHAAMKAHVAKDDGSLGYRERAMVNTRMSGLYSKLAGLSKHVIVTAHEVVEYESAGANLKAAGTKAAAATGFEYLFDYILQLDTQHRARVIKQAGPQLSGNGWLQSVSYQTFEVVLSGQPALTVGWSKADMKSFASWCRDAHGLSDGEMLTALGGIAGLREWSGTLDEANQQVNEWLNSQIPEA